MDQQQLEGQIEAIRRFVRSGMTPEQAASQLRLVGAPSEMVEAALSRFRHEADRIRTMREPGAVIRQGRQSWYLGPAPDDIFWPSYRRFLAESGWHEDDLQSLDAATTKVVSLLEHPSQGRISTRGLVLGYVQSGKTANFTGVVAKAADAGYRLIIILAGLNNNLREQTQKRLERDLFSHNEQKWFALTLPLNDFSRRIGNVENLLAPDRGHVVGIVKKNASRLRALCEWLEGARADTLRQCPALIIDDEADQATPNAHPDPSERTRINALIVRLLNSLPKAAYVGYTATPFANFFIDPDLPEDLYPRDFIVDMPRSDSYFGPERIFGRAPLNGEDPSEVEDGLDMIRRVDESEVPILSPGTRDRHQFQPQITASLDEALRWFFLAAAARRARGQEAKHMTMLVHTSQYTAVHHAFRIPFEAAVDQMKRNLQSRDAALLQVLEAQWQAEINRVPASLFDCQPVLFDELEPHLLPALSATEVKIENSLSDSRLDYDGAEEGNGRTYIVIGGNVLSRGLTLEGLCVSYFVRSASAFDTLLQMGRWFGYRPGYADLARVWMTDELKQYFSDLAGVEKEIRLEVQRYENSLYSPAQVGVRVRTHPHLAITSKLKMQHAVAATMSYAAQIEQTLRFYQKDERWLKKNLEAGRSLVKALQNAEHEPEQLRGRAHRVFRGTDASHIIRFLKQYQIHLDHVHLGDKNGDYMHRYIQQENEKGRLQKWNVVLVTRDAEDSVLGSIDLGLPEKIPAISRSRHRGRGNLGEADIKALMSEKDALIDVDLPLSEMEDWPRKEWIKRREEHYPDTGLLLLYPISKNSAPRSPSETRVPIDTADDVLGIALVFPNPQDPSVVSYMTVDLSGVAQEHLTDEDVPDNETDGTAGSAL